jgi:hypothetical protein
MICRCGEEESEKDRSQRVRRGYWESIEFGGGVRKSALLRDWMDKTRKTITTPTRIRSVAYHLGFPYLETAPTNYVFCPVRPIVLSTPSTVLSNSPDDLCYLIVSLKLNSSPKTPSEATFQLGSNGLRVHVLSQLKSADSAGRRRQRQKT